MKYYKQWTQFETQLSAYMNLRKAYGNKFLMKADYGRIDIWNLQEKHLLTLFVEASSHPGGEAFNEFIPKDGVRQFRLCGQSTKIVELLAPYLT